MFAFRNFSIFAVFATRLHLDGVVVNVLIYITLPCVWELVRNKPGGGSEGNMEEVGECGVQRMSPED